MLAYFRFRVPQKNTQHLYEQTLNHIQNSYASMYFQFSLCKFSNKFQFITSQYSMFQAEENGKSQITLHANGCLYVLVVKVDAF